MHWNHASVPLSSPVHKPVYCKEKAYAQLCIYYTFYTLLIITLQICPSSGLPCDCGAASAVETGAEVATDSDDKLVIGGAATSAKPTTEPIFPSELKTRVPKPLELPGPQASWFRYPISLLACAQKGKIKKQFKAQEGTNEPQRSSVFLEDPLPVA